MFTNHVVTVSLFLFISVLIESPSSLAADDQQKASDELRKDVSELGIEVIDQISAAAGNAYTGAYVRVCIRHLRSVLIDLLTG